MPKETKSESEASIIGGLVLACGNVYNEQGTQISKEVGQYIFSQRQKDRDSLVSTIKGMKKTKTFPQSLNRFDGTVEYFERLSDSDIHYNQALADLEQAINKIMK